MSLNEDKRSLCGGAQIDACKTKKDFHDTNKLTRQVADYLDRLKSTAPADHIELSAFKIFCRSTATGLCFERAVDKRVEELEVAQLLMQMSDTTIDDIYQETFGKPIDG